MSDFIEGITQLEAVRRKLDRDQAERAKELLAHSELIGAHFHPGDLVRDKLTRRLGRVKHTEFRNIQTPAPRREGD